jgi:salicylate hydroxylase
VLNQVEDAVTLGTLFSHLSNRKQIPIFTETYEELRQRRTNEARISEYQALVQISLPHGELQEGRDEALKLTLSPAFDDFENCEFSDLLVHAWEQYLVLFSHDAGEAVDNWWSKWGFTVEK